MLQATHKRSAGLAFAANRFPESSERCPARVGGRQNCGARRGPKLCPSPCGSESRGTRVRPRQVRPARRDGACRSRGSDRSGDGVMVTTMAPNRSNVAPSMERSVRPGRHAPLGATFDGQGVNFAVYSETARPGMDVALFDEHGVEKQTLPPREQTMHVWHGIRSRAPARPTLRIPRPRRLRSSARAASSIRTSCSVDPYARSIEGKIDYKEPVFAYTARRSGFAGTQRAAERARCRSARQCARRSQVRRDRRCFDWEGDARPHVPWAETRSSTRCT